MLFYFFYSAVLEADIFLGFFGWSSKVTIVSEMQLLFCVLLGGYLYSVLLRWLILQWVALSQSTILAVHVATTNNH
jgi:hypothetical protein